jgi:hypothetical protein
MLGKFKIAVIYLLPVILFGAIIALFNETSPLRVGPLGILSVFGLVYLLVLAVLSAFAYFCMALIGHFRAIERITKRRWYSVSAIVAIAPILLLALNTTGQLAIKDVVLVLLLVSFVCFYISKKVV